MDRSAQAVPTGGDGLPLFVQVKTEPLQLVVLHEHLLAARLELAHALLIGLDLLKACHL